MTKIVKYVERYGVNRTFISKECAECKKKIEVLESEVKRGGGLTCSRKCFYKRFKKIVKKDNTSPNWKGNNVGKTALHNWVERKLGKPKFCEHCKSEIAKKYEWANKSRKYKRNLSDWVRLCTKCHSKYDYMVRIKKWRKSVKKLGWKTK